MTQGQLEIQAIAVVTAVACALVGTFLVLRRQSLVSDAIGHSVLVGIALAFLVVGTTTSPLLLVAAALTGVLTVALVELVTSTRLVKEDAAIGLVFPALFSVGVIVVSRYADGVHLDTDAVLLGELAFAPFDRLEAWGWDFGPASLLLMGGVLVLDVVVVAVLWKELKLSTFDASLALALGFAPVLMNYVLMTLVSVTAVGAFNAVGSILVVALMIAPPAAAYLLTDGLGRMTALACAIGGGSALAGYWLAVALDASIAGCIASCCGIAFALAWAFAPGRGLVAAARRRSRQRLEFAQAMLAIHLANHEGRPEAAVENRVAHLGEHLRWEGDFAARVVRGAERRGLVVRHADALALTDRGRALAQEAVAS
ncbi:MAG TPA: metal ABC transporter permease [Gaiella sp.]|nr:metal ABC transporter permease [Gaiella sp.]